MTRYPASWKSSSKKALRKNREERYQTARDIFNDLRNLARELNSVAGRGHLSSGDPEAAVGGAAGSSDARSAPLPSATGISAARPSGSSAEHVVEGIRRHKAGVLLAVAAAGLGFTLYSYAGRGCDRQP